MKRFAIALSDDLHAEFYRCFPNHGLRSAILRSCIKQLIKKVKQSSATWDKEAVEVVDKIMETEAKL